MQIRHNRIRSWACGLLVPFGMVLAPAVAQDEPPPLPPPRPDRPATPPGEPAQVQPDPGAPSEAQVKAADSKDEACIARLTRLGVQFESKPPVQENACSVQDPVLVSRLSDGLEIAPASLMTCAAAESLARWAGEVLRPEAERHFQSAPKKVLIGTSYQCRNQRSGEKLSEHAFGNAVDVMGFHFATRAPLTIKTQQENSPEAAFQLAVQKGACPIFTTVLGPGADADHGDHLHLDMRARKGGYRICQ